MVLGRRGCDRALGSYLLHSWATAMKRLPHVKLTKHEFIMLRSLARMSWQSTDPVLWRFHREWRANYAWMKLARAAAESLCKRGLVNAVPQLGFSPVTPGERVKLYTLNERGEALLAKANAFNAPKYGPPEGVTPQFIALRPWGSIWGRFLRTLRRRRSDTHTSQLNEAGDRT